MSDRERVALYMYKNGDTDEMMLFGTAHIHMRGTYHREVIKHAVDVYRCTGLLPDYVNEYLLSLKTVGKVVVQSTQLH